MNESKKNDLRKLCNIFRFNSINEGGEITALGKKNDDKNEASFLDLDIKIKDAKFHFGLFDTSDLFPFSIVRMQDKSSNVPSSIVHSTICAE